MTERDLEGELIEGIRRLIPEIPNNIVRLVLELDLNRSPLVTVTIRPSTGGKHQLTKVELPVTKPHHGDDT